MTRVSTAGNATPWNTARAMSPAGTRGVSIATGRGAVPPFEEFFLDEYRGLFSIAAVIWPDRSITASLAATSLYAIRDNYATMRNPSDEVRRILVRRTRRLSGSFGRLEARRLARAEIGCRFGAPSRVDAWMWHALAAMPLEHRAAVAFYEIDQMAVLRIARILECSGGRAALYLHEGLANLSEAEDAS